MNRIERIQNRSLASSIILLMLTAMMYSHIGPGLAGDLPSPEVMKVLETKEFTGEPYELTGNRMVFTNWWFIRPGVLYWRNQEGARVNTTREPVYGPWDAQIDRPSSPYGIRIATQPAQRGAILESEYPWEADGVRIRTIIREGGKLRAWGSCDPGGSCYFESTDGVTWERPILKLKEFNGSKFNNLLASSPVGCVFIDPTGSPGERYKSVGGPSIEWEAFEAFRKKHPDRWQTRALEAHGDSVGIRALNGAISPDGYTWTELPELFTVEKSDGLETGYYDPVLKKYVIYVRNWWTGRRSSRWQWDGRETWQAEKHGSGRRSIGRSESDDFRNFHLSEHVIVPTAGNTLPSETFYTSNYTTIPGAPDHHLMLPAIWDTRDDTCSIGMWSSADGILWERIPGPPLLETAPFEQWDGGCLFAYPNLFERADGAFAMSYMGYNYPHKYPRGSMEWKNAFMVWPKGRIVAVEADEIGEFTTIGLMPPGRKLRINALTSRAGGIRVEIASLLDEPLEGRTFADCDIVQGDRFWSPVTWNGVDDIGIENGEAIVIRFHLDRAKLFGIQFD